MPKTKGHSSPFKPSWMDRSFDWVETLPLPFFYFYLVAYGLIVLAYHILLWIDQTLVVGESSPILFAQTFWFVSIAAVWHYIRHTSTNALERLKPALQMSPSEFEDLKYRFTHLSVRTGWVLTLLGVASLVIALPAFEDYMGPLFFSPLTTYLSLITIFIFPINLGAFFIVCRTTVLINKIYAKVRNINLFNLTPLYALSSITSRLGMIFIGFILFNILTAPFYQGATAASFGIFYIALAGGLSVLVFVLPLQGIHRRLVKAKEHAAEVNNHLIDSGFAKMQALVAREKHAEVAELRASNSALLDYRTEINKISTWPWDIATLRTFVTALAVPMTVWIVQQVLIRTVGQ